MAGIIVVEGADGSGKSTMVDYIGKKLDAVVIHSTNYAPAFSGMTEAMHENLAKYVPFHFQHYIETASVYKPLIEEQLGKDKYVVLDRYIYSTRVTHKVFDKLYCNGQFSEQIERLADIAESALPKPDLIIWLRVEEKERRLRLLLRTSNSIDTDSKLIVLFDAEFSVEFGRLARQGFAVAEIDNSVSFAETIKEVDKAISSMLEKSTSKVHV